MKHLVKLSLIALMGIGITLQSCQKEESTRQGEGDLKSQGTNTFYGSTVPFAGGTARAWIQVDGNGNGDPIAVGIDLSENALENLPDEPVAIVLDLPKNKGGNFYTHMLVDWNPHGHLPIYGAPHFDFHFYIIPNEERLQIGENDPEMNILPAEQYRPPLYMNIPGGVPQMGAHWIDLLSPEIAGTGEFTQTFIWGSYDGSFIFFEPMITTEFLLTHPNETYPLRQPEAYETDGWYATDYSINYTTRPGKYTVALRNLVHHEAE